MQNPHKLVGVEISVMAELYDKLTNNNNADT